VIDWKRKKKNIRTPIQIVSAFQIFYQNECLEDNKWKSVFVLNTEKHPFFSDSFPILGYLAT
jgi:hypothetical protein